MSRNLQRALVFLYVSANIVDDDQVALEKNRQWFGKKLGNNCNCRLFLSFPFKATAVSAWGGIELAMHGV